MNTKVPRARGGRGGSEGVWARGLPSLVSSCSKALRAARGPFLLGLALPLAIVVAIGCATLFAEKGTTEGTFSHEFHLAAFTDIKCESCHAPVRTGGTPGKYMALVDMNLCAKCHDPARSKGLRAQVEKFLEPRRVGTFDHEKHAAKAKLECVACHASVAKSRAASDRNVPPMETCWTCHARLTTFAGESGARCALCHQAQDWRGAPPEKRAVFADVIAKNTPPGEVPGTVMPPAHAKLLGDLWAGEIDEDQVPADHTEIFRQRTHGRLSQAPTAKCYACHWQQDCAECHQTMRPSDHTLRFDRSIHGRFAAARPDRCAACHQADFCVACHETPPPGHTLSFRTTGAHGQQARLGARSCFTCHAFEEDCSRCHNR